MSKKQNSASYWSCPHTLSKIKQQVSWNVLPSLPTGLLLFVSFDQQPVHRSYFSICVRWVSLILFHLLWHIYICIYIYTQRRNSPKNSAFMKKECQYFKNCICIMWNVTTNTNDKLICSKKLHFKESESRLLNCHYMSTWAAI